MLGPLFLEHLLVFFIVLGNSDPGGHGHHNEAKNCLFLFFGFFLGSMHFLVGDFLNLLALCGLI